MSEGVSEDRRAGLQKMKDFKSRRSGGIGGMRAQMRRNQTIKIAQARHDYLLNAVTWDVFAPPPSNSVKVSFDRL